MKMARKLKFFQDLIGDNFELSNQKIPTDFALHYDENRIQKLDIKKGDEWNQDSIQTKVDIKYKLKDFTKNQLINWLDQHVKRKEYSQDDKRKFLTKLSDSLLKSKKKNYDLSDLTINCWKLKDEIDNAITKIEHTTAKNTFDKYVKNGKIVANNDFVEFPSETTIKNPHDAEFNNHLYERAGKMNGEELVLAKKLDLLDNIKWWFRSVEKQDDFFIQGWHRDKFYPDFIVKTESGVYVVIEYKGENLITNIDTDYKKELGKKWAKLAGDNYRFYLIGKDKIDDTVKEIGEM